MLAEAGNSGEQKGVVIVEVVKVEVVIATKWWWSGFLAEAGDSGEQQGVVVVEVVKVEVVITTKW